MAVERLTSRGPYRARSLTALSVAAAAFTALALVACGPEGQTPPAAAPGADAGSAAAPAPGAPAPEAPAPEATTPATTPAAAPAPATTNSPTTPVDPSICRSTALSVTLGGAEGAAGTVYASLKFTNTGPNPCVLHGFPGVSYVSGDNGNQVGPAAERDGVKGAAVSLPHGGVASAQLGMVRVLNYDPSACHPTPIKGLRVYPPGETASVFVPFRGTGCSSNPPGPQLRVKTIQSGPGQN